MSAQPHSDKKTQPVHRLAAADDFGRFLGTATSLGVGERLRAFDFGGRLRGGLRSDTIGGGGGNFGNGSASERAKIVDALDECSASFIEMSLR